MNLELEEKQIQKRKYLKEYGLKILHLMLVKEGFNYYSFTKKSIP